VKPDFSTARAQRGTVYLKMGDYDKAERDFYDVLQEDPYNEETNYLFQRVNPAQEQISQITFQNDHHTALTLLTLLLEISPWSPEIQELVIVFVGDAEMHRKNSRSVFHRPKKLSKTRVRVIN
jgi:DnaJ homolog subfamily C member 3